METCDPPAGCDYNFWLGPAPLRAFNPNRFSFNWRWFWDYGGGLLTDFCCHIVDLVHWAMDVDAPRAVDAARGLKAASVVGQDSNLVSDVFMH